MNFNIFTLTVLATLLSAAAITQATSSSTFPTTAASASPDIKDCPLDQLYDFYIAMLPLHSRERHEHISGEGKDMDIRLQDLGFLNIPTVTKNFGDALQPRGESR
jgi:hypothetical protein